MLFTAVCVTCDVPCVHIHRCCGIIIHNKTTIRYEEWIERHALRPAVKEVVVHRRLEELQVGVGDGLRARLLLALVEVVHERVSGHRLEEAAQLEKTLYLALTQLWATRLVVACCPCAVRCCRLAAAATGRWRILDLEQIVDFGQIWHELLLLLQIERIVCVHERPLVSIYIRMPHE